MADVDVLVLGSEQRLRDGIFAAVTEHRGTQLSLAWAVADGSSEAEAVAASHGPGKPMRVTYDNDETLERELSRVRVVVDALEDYAEKSESLVRVCARSGFSYCNVLGDVVWQSFMIGKYQEKALETNATLIFGLGFLSPLSDMLVYQIADVMEKKHSSKIAQVRLVWTEVRVGWNDNPLWTILTEGQAPAENVELLGDPYLLNPPGSIIGLPTYDDQKGVIYDVDAKRYTVPWLTGVANTRVVRRTDALLNHSYGGTSFTYTESFGGGLGDGFLLGLLPALFLHMLYNIIMYLRRFQLFQRTYDRLFHSHEARGDNPKGDGVAEALITARDDQGAHLVQGKFRCERNPNYGITSLLVAEAAMLLARERRPDSEIHSVEGGCLTPVACFKGALMNQLLKAGAKFTVDYLF
mmetsp:Transcript_6738/g.20405  ORF Transcript_6738/g.20405 Transcript_6738/m.20405 type:complete len:410 (-) Transcript_6738:426-1655(-)